jgi:threonine dehydrogenase-like Zn-dependent dehydrogenase
MLKQAITTRLVDTTTTATLVRLLVSGTIRAEELITHSTPCPLLFTRSLRLLIIVTGFSFREIEAAYDTFKKAAEKSALKVLISM